MLMRIAWRNLWRNRNRSLLIMLSLALGVWASSFLDAFYSGMVRQRIRDAIETETSSMQVHRKGFLADRSVGFILNDGHRLLDSIRMNPAVAAASGRIVIEGMLASPTGSAGVLALAVDPGGEMSLTRLGKRVVEGRYFNGAGRHEMIMGGKLMRKLGLHVGAKAVLSFSGAGGEIASSAYRVVGRFETVNKPLESTVVYIGLAGTDSLAAIDGSLNEIAVRFIDDRYTEPFVSGLNAVRPGEEAASWKELSPETGLLATMYDKIMIVYLGIILLGLSFGVVNTMLMSVLERRREIGMLLSLGMNRKRVFGMVMLETMFLSFAGCPLGFLMSGLSIWAGARKGIKLGMFSDVYESFGFSDRVYPVFEAGSAFLLLGLVLVMALLASLLPARLAVRTNPAEAIRK